MTNTDHLPPPPKMPISAIRAMEELQAKYEGNGPVSTGIKPNDNETVRPPKHR